MTKRLLLLLLLLGIIIFGEGCAKQRIYSTYKTKVGATTYSIEIYNYKFGQIKKWNAAISHVTVSAPGTIVRDGETSRGKWKYLSNRIENVLKSPPASLNNALATTIAQQAINYPNGSLEVDHYDFGPLDSRHLILYQDLTNGIYTLRYLHNNLGVIENEVISIPPAPGLTENKITLSDASSFLTNNSDYLPGVIEWLGKNGVQIANRVQLTAASKSLKDASDISEGNAKNAEAALKKWQDALASSEKKLADPNSKKPEKAQAKQDIQNAKAIIAAAVGTVGSKKEADAKRAKAIADLKAFTDAEAYEITVPGGSNVSLPFTSAGITKDEQAAQQKLKQDVETAQANAKVTAENTGDNEGSSATLSSNNAVAGVATGSSNATAATTVTTDAATHSTIVFGPVTFPCSVKDSNHIVLNNVQVNKTAGGYKISFTKLSVTDTSTDKKVVKPDTVINKPDAFDARTAFDSKLFKAWLAGSKYCDEKADEIYDMIKVGIVDYETNQRNARYVQDLAHVADSFQDKDVLAGRMRLVSKSIQLKDHNGNKIVGAILEVDTVQVMVDYNRISDIAIVGHLKKGKQSKLILVKNDSYSIGFKALKNGAHTISIEDKMLLGGQKANINFSDVIFYGPAGANFSRIVPNQSVSLYDVNKSENIYRRTYSDYLSLRIFLDPLGFIDSVPNSIAMLEGATIIPLNLNNCKKFNLFPQLSASLQYLYASSANLNPRIAPSYTLNSDVPRTDTPEKYETIQYVRNLDFMRYYHYSLLTRLSLFAIEIKAMNSWLHIEGGFRVAGARINTNAANTESSIYHKILPELGLRLEFRPDQIFGGSIGFAGTYLGNLHLGNNDVGDISSPQFLYKNSVITSHELNFYMLTGTRNANGLFFRYTGYLSFNGMLRPDESLNPSLKSLPFTKTEYIPQILIGYSTNLSTLIKRQVLNVGE